MKKLILPLLLLVAFGMLAAVESAPSEVVGYVKYDCLAGLNMVAMPMVDGLTLTSEVGAVYNVGGDYIDTINIWDPVTQTWTYATNYGGGFWDPDLPVATGSILYFNTTQALTFYSIGDMPAANAQYSIVPGLNTIMVPLNKSALSLTSLVGLDIGTGEDLDTINLWDATTQTWAYATNYGGGFWDPDLTVGIGSPLFVNSLSTVSWPTGPRGSTPFSRSLNK